MHISSLFYTARFRKLIADLKQQGVFREAPLYELDKLVYLAFAPLLIMGAAKLLKGGTVSWLLLLILAAMGVSLSLYETNYRINKIIIPCSIGRLEPVILETEPFYGQVHLGMRAWVFFYYFESPNKQFSDLAGIRLPKSYRSPFIPKELLNKGEFLSQPKRAFVDPENPENNCPYVRPFVHKYRMTTSSISMENRQ